MAAKAQGKLDELFSLQTVLVTRDAPQQSNGSDCGVHLLAAAEYLHTLYREDGSLEKACDKTFAEKLGTTGTAAMRRSLRSLIEAPTHEVGSAGIL